MVEVCRKCGVPLFEVSHDPNRKQYRSYAMHSHDDEHNDIYYLCIDCHEGRNKEMFENANRADKSLSEEET